jgi:endonuclease/exonuclease/phosphatase family metal-dependent hydrolase
MDDNGMTATLRVMTYNVRYFGHGTRGVVATRGRLRRVARALALLAPPADIVCLQEVEACSLRSALSPWHRGQRGRTQLDALLFELHRMLARAGRLDRYEALYFPAHAYRLMARTNFFTTGLAIMVRAPLRVIAHNGGVVHDITHRRVAQRWKQTRIVAHVAVGHATHAVLDVFNTHLSLPSWSAPEFWLGEGRLGFGENQLAEARRIAELVRHRKRARHVVLAGDFNSVPGSPVDELLRCEMGLVDAHAHHRAAQGRRAGDWSTAGFLRTRLDIDRIYATPELEWLDFEGSEPFARRGSSVFAGLSDHVPVVGRLRTPA